MNRSFLTHPIILAAGFVVFFAAAFAGCDKGLTPVNTPSGFSGVIRFKNWPDFSKVLELRLVAFQEFPSDSVGIFPALLAGQVAIYPQVGSTGLPHSGQDSVSYVFTTAGTLLQVTNYKYIALAQRYGTGYFTDWKPCGVYAVSPGSFEPAVVRVLLHRVVPNVDLNVDFNNPPPKPWE